MKRLALLLGCASFCAGVAFAQSPVTLTIDNSPGHEIPGDFIGISFETGTLPGAKLFNATNAPLITLFQNLGIRNLRIGGATVESPKESIPSNGDIDALFSFARAVGDLKLIYSLRLYGGDSATDAATARYIWTNYRAQLSCFALGNEPDWKSQQTVDPALTNYTSYQREWNAFAKAITNAAPGATFAGPDTGGNFDNGVPDGANGKWAHNGIEWTTRFARDEKNSGLVTLITQHHYVAYGSTATNNAAAYIAAMLSPGWDTVTNQALYAVMAAPVIADGFAYRFTEAEDCVGGVPGASDTFAGALWALDFMHWWAAHDCAGVNFHNSRWRTNAVITLNNSTHQLSIRPKGYGLKAFDLGGHGRVEQVGITNPDGLNLTAYAVGDGTNLFVTVINKEIGTDARAANVKILVSGFPDASVAAMNLTDTHDNLTAKGVITLGGDSITNDTPWRGEWTALGSVTNDQCTIKVAASSAAIVKITATQRSH